MSKHVLVTLDGSEFAERAIDLAIDLAKEWSLSLRLLQVVPLNEHMESAQLYLNEKLALAKETKVLGEAKVLLGSAVETIIEQSEDSEILVMASHGHSGFDSLFLGSVTLKVMRRCPVPLLVVREKPTRLREMKKVLVPLDSYQQSTKALVPAVSICEATGATLTLAQVSEATGVDIGLVSREDETQRMGSYLQEQKGSIGSEIQIDTLSLFGSATRSLLNLIEEHEFDLVVITSHGQGDFNRWVCGSVTENIMRCSATPVLLLRAQAARCTSSFPQDPEEREALLSSTIIQGVP